MSNNNLWNIHGKQYDLTTFMDSHPGGKKILELTQGLHDISALFETYHAFSNKESITKILSKYEVGSTELTESYNFDSYHELTDRVKTELNITRSNTKANYLWFGKNILLALGYMLSFYWAINFADTYLGQIISGSLIGFLIICLGFNIMHDGLHFGLFKDPNTNWFFGSVMNNLLLWNPNTWFYHHTYSHHSFTGNEKLDPDMKHFRPFIKKFDSDKRTYSSLQSIQHWLIMPFSFLFPGLGFGQILSYIQAIFMRRIFGTKIPKNIKLYSLSDFIVLGIKLYLLSKLSFISLISYIIAYNATYHINISLDHDTYDNAVINHLSPETDKTNDWLKIQIQNSANFVPNNKIWTHLFGGINYQIEHHLFPNICHVHYPRISKVVKQYCNEENIKYTAFDSIFDAYVSFLKTIKYFSKSRLF